MGGFFDPNPRPETLFPNYGAGHLVILGIALLLLAQMIWQKDRMVRWRENRRIMAGISIAILIGEIQEYTMMIVHGYEPAYELLPLHLCGMLALLLPILTLFERYDILKFIAGWSVAAGLISFLNLGITHNSPAQLTFFHYCWKHYYLFLFPIFLFIADEYEFAYAEFLGSMAGLLTLSALIFLANWIFGTNYMYIGPENEMEVPFLPDAWLRWPVIYASFIGVGLVLFHGIYGGFALAQWRRRRRAASASTIRPADGERDTAG